MVGFDKAFADGAIAFFKIKITGLADRAVEFLGLLGRRAITLNFAVVGVFAGVVQKRLRFKLSSKKIDGNRVYRIEGASGAGSNTRGPGRRSA